MTTNILNEQITRMVTEMGIPANRFTSFGISDSGSEILNPCVEVSTESIEPIEETVSVPQGYIPAQQVSPNRWVSTGNSVLTNTLRRR